MPIPTIPVVILQYGKFDLTEKCIESLRAQKGVVTHIWLVDGCSPDKNAEVLEKLASLADRHTFLEKNPGFAAGNNGALKELMGESWESVLVLNNDTYLEPNALLEMHDTLMRHPQAGQVCPLLLYGDGRVQGAGGTIRHDLFEPGMIGNQDHDASRYQTEHVVTFASGCAVLVRMKALQHVGLISEDYYMYSEDVDWSLRFTKAGYEVWYCPKSHVTHYESVAAGAYSAFKGYYVVRGNVLLAHAWLETQDYGLFIKRMRAKLIRQSVKYARYPQYVWGMWWGFKDGMRQITGRVDVG
jgi:GT2 family glycosyltransferase